MYMFELFWLGLFLGLIGAVLKYFIKINCHSSDIFPMLVGGCIFGAITSVSLHPIATLDRTSIVLIIALGYFGADITSRTVDTRK